MLKFLPVALQFLLGSLLWVDQPLPLEPMPLSFALRHLHGVSNSTRVVWKDIASTSVDADISSFKEIAGQYSVNTRHVSPYRPASPSAFASARFRSMRRMQSEPLVWHEVDVVGPDVANPETLLKLAEMTSNAYYERDHKSWYELGAEWNNMSYPFGWEPDADGFRGHVFVATDNSTVIISIKGTSTSWYTGGGGPTVIKDKLNDNLLFSCCCARVGPSWSPVCGCYAGGYKCDQSCVENSLVDNSLFYSLGLNLYNNVTYMYPHANIWLIGHSLGGSLASLLGATFGAPVVAYEAPGERMAAQRLHLPLAPSLHHIAHVYHTADPIPMGTCTGVGSVCAIGGYALESRCHLGKSLVYDTVTKLGWSVDARKHGIVYVIDNLLNHDWEGGIPEMSDESDCIDCHKWEYGDFNKSLIGQ